MSQENPLPPLPKLLDRYHRAVEEHAHKPSVRNSAEIHAARQDAEREMRSYQKELDDAWDENEKVVGLFGDLIKRAEAAEASRAQVLEVLRELVEAKAAFVEIPNDFGYLKKRDAALTRLLEAEKRARSLLNPEA